MSEPKFNPFNPEFDIYKGSKTPSKQTEEEEPNDVYSDYSKSNINVDSNERERITLEKIPMDEPTQKAANIYADKLEYTAKIYMKMAQDARQNGYFPTNKEEQDELILGAEAWNRYLEPLKDDRYSVDYISLFEELIEQYRKDNRFPDDRHFIREIKWKIEDNGHISNEYPYTENHLLGKAMVNRINDIIMISDCLPSMKNVWLNNRKTRLEEQLKRDAKKFNKKKRVTKNNQTKSNRVIDPDDYDDTIQGIHDDPERTLITPVSIRDPNEWPEYDAFPEAYDLGFMRKDKPNDYTEYWKAYSAFVKLKLKEQRE